MDFHDTITESKPAEPEGRTAGAARLPSRAAVEQAVGSSFPFAGADCEAMTETIVRRLGRGDGR